MNTLSCDRERAVLELRLSPELLHFQGHYTGAPVLPGVTQLHWAVEQARRCFALACDPVGVRSLKFHHVIRPDDVVRLELARDADRGTVAFRYHSDQGTHASGQLNWPDGG